MEPLQPDRRDIGFSSARLMVKGELFVRKQNRALISVKIGQHERWSQKWMSFKPLRLRILFLIMIPTHNIAEHHTEMSHRYFCQYSFSWVPKPVSSTHLDKSQNSLIRSCCWLIDSSGRSVNDGLHIRIQFISVCKPFKPKFFKEASFSIE